MTATVHATWVSQVVRHLPASLVKVLDAWSRRVARQRAQQRRQKWLERQAAVQQPIKVLGD